MRTSKGGCHALANLKVVAAEWMEKADNLKGKLTSAQAHQEKVNAALNLKEEQIKALKKNKMRSNRKCWMRYRRS